MRYAYHDLGERKAGSAVVVRWRGGGADVLLLDPVSFSKYCRQKELVFDGGRGHFRRPPARLAVPKDGRWYVAVDLRGYSGRAQATVEVLEPHAEEQLPEQTLAEVG